MLFFHQIINIWTSWILRRISRRWIIWMGGWRIAWMIMTAASLCWRWNEAWGKPLLSAALISWFMVMTAGTNGWMWWYAVIIVTVWNFAVPMILSQSAIRPYFLKTEMHKRILKAVRRSCVHCRWRVKIRHSKCQIIWDFIRKFMIKCSLRKNFCWWLMVWMRSLPTGFWKRDIQSLTIFRHRSSWQRMSIYYWPAEPVRRNRWVSLSVKG